MPINKTKFVICNGGKKCAEEKLICTGLPEKNHLKPSIPINKAGSIVPISTPTAFKRLEALMPKKLKKVQPQMITNIIGSIKNLLDAYDGLKLYVMVAATKASVAGKLIELLNHSDQMVKNPAFFPKAR